MALGAGALCLVLALLLLVVNLYLQSDGVQGRIKQAAATSLGGDVRIKSTFFTPWGGFVVGGISLPDPERPEISILEARELRIRFALLPLVTGRLVITQVLLMDPTLIARQREDRTWVMLVPPPPEPKIAVTVPESASRGGGARSLSVEVRTVAVRGATIAFVDAMGRTLLRAEKADCEARIGESKTCEGAFDIGRLTLGQALRPRKISGPFHWDGKVLSLPKIAGMLAGGSLDGSYTLATGDEPRFKFQLALAGVKLVKLIEEAGGNADGASGLLRGTIELAGNHADQDSINGSARFDLEGGRFVPVDFLVQFGKLFSVDELQVLELSEAVAEMTVADSEVRLDRASLKSKNLILAGDGTASFAGELDIDAALLVNKHLQKQLAGVMGKNFQDSEEEGYKQLEFSVFNTLANPRTDLLDKLVGQKVPKEVGGFLRQLLGPPRENKTGSGQ
jgi:uncharacterized protein involved in outer membrane biogenesis